MGAIVRVLSHVPSAVMQLCLARVAATVREPASGAVSVYLLPFTETIKPLQGNGDAPAKWTQRKGLLHGTFLTKQFVDRCRVPPDRIICSEVIVVKHLKEDMLFLGRDEEVKLIISKPSRVEGLDLRFRLRRVATNGNLDKWIRGSLAEEGKVTCCEIASTENLDSNNTCRPGRFQVGVLESRFCARRNLLSIRPTRTFGDGTTDFAALLD